MSRLIGDELKVVVRPLGRRDLAGAFAAKQNSRSVGRV